MECCACKASAAWALITLSMSIAELTNKCEVVFDVSLPGGLRFQWPRQQQPTTFLLKESEVERSSTKGGSSVEYHLY
jgi:hypothetical protein